LQWFRHVDFFVPQSGGVARRSFVIVVRSFRYPPVKAGAIRAAGAHSAMRSPLQNLDAEGQKARMFVRSQRNLSTQV
jgi:hypothetical protein